jgi:hypothetical protein
LTRETFGKIINKNKRTTGNIAQKRTQPEAKSAGVMRVFYILLLLMTVLSLVARIGGGRAASTAHTGGGNTARVLVFHHEDGSSCEDLTITAAGNVVFSNCGKGVEKQYALNDVERTQLQTWLNAYSAVNYDPNQSTQTGASSTQLYLNGTGTHQPTQTDIQQMIDFAENLAVRMASQS